MPLPSTVWTYPRRLDPTERRLRHGQRGASRRSGDNLGLTVTINLGQVNGLNGRDLIRDGVHQASTVFGSTRSRLPDPQEAGQH